MAIINKKTSALLYFYIQNYVVLAQESINPRAGIDVLYHAGISVGMTYGILIFIVVCANCVSRKYRSIRKRNSKESVNVSGTIPRGKGPVKKTSLPPAPPQYIKKDSAAKVETTPKTRSKGRDSIPSQKIDSMSSNKRGSIPSQKRDSLPSHKRDSISSQKRDSLPSTKRDSIPSQKRDSIPSQKRDSIPRQKRDSNSREIPLMRKESEL